MSLGIGQRQRGIGRTCWYDRHIAHVRLRKIGIDHELALDGGSHHRIMNAIGLSPPLTRILGGASAQPERQTRCQQTSQQQTR